MRRTSLGPRITILAVALALVPLVSGSTFSAEAATATFGNTTVGSAVDSPGSGYKFGSVHQLTQAGTTSSFSFYAQGGNQPQRMIPVIYRVDAAGNPTALVVKGSEVVIAANRPAGWITSTLPAVALPSGSYCWGCSRGRAGSRRGSAIRRLRTAASGT